MVKEVGWEAQRVVEEPRAETVATVAVRVVEEAVVASVEDWAEVVAQTRCIVRHPWSNKPCLAATSSIVVSPRCSRNKRDMDTCVRNTQLHSR